MSTPNIAKNGSIDRLFGLINISLLAVVQVGRCLLGCVENATYRGAQPALHALCEKPAVFHHQ